MATSSKRARLCLVQVLHQNVGHLEALLAGLRHPDPNGTILKRDQAEIEGDAAGAAGDGAFQGLRPRPPIFRQARGQSILTTLTLAVAAHRRVAADQEESSPKTLNALNKKYIASLRQKYKSEHFFISLSLNAFAKPARITITASSRAIASPARLLIAYPSFCGF